MWTNETIGDALATLAAAVNSFACPTISKPTKKQLTKLACLRAIGIGVPTNEPEESKDTSKHFYNEDFDEKVRICCVPKRSRGARNANGNTTH